MIQGATLIRFMVTIALFILLPRNTNQDGEFTPMQLGGRHESVCRGMTGSLEPAGGLEEEDEEGCGSSETRQRHSATAADALDSEQHPSCQEGEATFCSHAKRQKPFE